MEKKTSPTQLAYTGSFSIYRDDLEEIVTKLSEICDKVIIEDNEYRYDSLDEVLKKRGPNPKQLSIYSKEPLVIFNVRIKPGWTTLGTSGDGDNLPPYFYIKQILESRKRKGLNYILAGSPLVLLFGVIFALIIFPFSERLQIPAWVRWLSIFIVISILVALEYRDKKGAYTIVSLKRKHEEPSFWSRNKDQLIRQIISSILAFLLGLLAAYLLFIKGYK